MSTLFHLISDFVQDPDEASAVTRIAAPAALSELSREVTRLFTALRPFALSSGILQNLRGKDPLNQPQATRGVIRLLKQRPSFAAAAQVDPDELAVVAEKDEAYDQLASAMQRVAALVDNAHLVCQGASRDGADRLVAAIKQRIEELANDPVAQSELLFRFGALELNVRLAEERMERRRQRNERREEDATTTTADTRAASNEAEAVAHLLGEARGPRA